MRQTSLAFQMLWKTLSLRPITRAPLLGSPMLWRRVCSVFSVFLIERTPKDGQHRAFLPAGKVGTEAVPLHFEIVCHHHCGTMQCSEWKILGETRPTLWVSSEVCGLKKSSHIVPHALVWSLCGPCRTMESTLWTNLHLKLRSWSS